MNLLNSIILKFNQILNIFLLIYNVYHLNKYINHDELSYYYVKNIKKNINSIGVFGIKLVQWGLDRVKTIYDEKNIDKIYNEFERFYENCDYHDFEYTKKIYNKDFDSDILDDFEIDIEPIASGSIGQVYRGRYKNKLQKGKKIEVAIKVVHPNIKNEILVPKYILLFFNKLTKIFNCFNNYISIININDFFENLKNQINLDIESNNMRKMKKIYEDNSLIVIPKVYKNSNNIIIMSYEEGKYFENMNLSDYQKYKIINLLRLYLNSSCIVDNFVHTDLHNGNWKVRKHPLYNNIFQIVLLDFGLCSKLHDPDFVKKLHECFETNNYSLCLKIFIEFNKDLNKSITFEKVFEKFKEEYEYYLKSKKIDLNKVIKFFVKNNYRLCNNLFNICITTAICEHHFQKYMPSDFDNSENKNY